MHRPRVVPPAENHLAGRQHGRMEIQVLIETQLPYVTAVGVHQIDAACALHAVPAGDRRDRGGRDENDSAIRQIAGVEIIDIRMLVA